MNTPRIGFVEPNIERVDARTNSPAAEAQPAYEKRADPIVFVDHTEKRHLFPWSECKTWEGIETLVKQVYSHYNDDALSAQVSGGSYDLLSIQGHAILPALWASTVEPGWVIVISFSPQAVSEEQLAGLRQLFDSIAPLRAESVVLLPDRREDDFPRAESRERFIERPRSRSRSRSPPRSADRVYRGTDSDEESTTSSDGDEESATSSEEDEEAIPPPERGTITPYDADDNPLSFLVDTYGHQSPQKPDAPRASEAKRSPGMARETLNILMSRMSISDGKTTVSLNTLDGPKSDSVSTTPDVSWHHLYADELDFVQFRSECLSILPEYSKRRRRLVTELLQKVEGNLRTYVEGLFIEPGTVIRVEEKQRDDSYTATFCCIPFFDLLPPPRPSATAADRLHPVRSLMQSYYPYEPVRDRDKEQAYRKYSYNSSKIKNIIQVPLLWMVIIGSEMVITCGYRKLSSLYGQSMNILPIHPFRQLASDASIPPTPAIRLTDWSGRMMFYSVEECRTYFQLEQKLRELRISAATSTDSFQMVLLEGQGERLITPAGWIDFLKSLTQSTSKKMIYDVRVLDEPRMEAFETGSPATDSGWQRSRGFASDVPPFFCWCRSKPREEVRKNPPRKQPPPENEWSPSKVAFQENGDAMSLSSEAAKAIEQKLIEEEIAEQQNKHISPDIAQVMRCLAQVERSLMTETLDAREASQSVEKAFTSAKYYESLPEYTINDLRKEYPFLNGKDIELPERQSLNTWHKKVVHSVLSKLSTLAVELISTVQRTLLLFVKDLDKSTMLRRLWGALNNIVIIVDRARQQGALEPDPRQYNDPNWQSPLTGNRNWIIRNKSNSIHYRNLSSLPPAESKALEQIIADCRDCRKNKTYDDPQRAVEHLKEHLTSAVEQTTADGQSNFDLFADHRLEEWIRNDSEMLIEERNAAYLAVLFPSIKAAKRLQSAAGELAEGVVLENGEMLDSYTFPLSLLETFRRLLVFYFAIERSIHFSHICFENRRENKQERNERETPFSKEGLGVLERFISTVELSLTEARKELCSMVRSEYNENDTMTRLFLGPEFMLGWLMRRLLVKPAENSMRIADLYRQYLSTLQFQVNHRPSKRLVRDINLIQEELVALDRINDWQVKLIENYTSILDDKTYQNDIPYRRAMFPIERSLLYGVLDHLQDNHEDYSEMLERCRPLAESAKQSTEINDEDHGKAILIFTIVTVVFLPLSFITSYLGMNTSDIRNMNNKQTLFWEIALPLTAITVGGIMTIAYNGDDIRDRATSTARYLMGKQSTSSVSLSVAQRKRKSIAADSSSTLLDYKNYTDQAEFALPIDTRSDFTTSIMPRKSGRAEYETYAGFPPPPPQGRSRTRSRPSELRMDIQAPVMPTYAKVSKRFVSPESLAHFNYPWEYDPRDPNYIIILRELQEHETEDLFDHTRRLRGQGPKRGQRVSYAEERYYRSDSRNRSRSKPEYSWVRRKKRSERKSDDILDLF